LLFFLIFTVAVILLAIEAAFLFLRKLLL